MVDEATDNDGFDETLADRASAFYEIARRMLDQQLGAVTTLENRLATAASLNAVIAALFAAAIALPSREPPVALWALAIVVLSLFAAGAFCGYQAVSARNWSVGIDPRDAQLFIHLDAGHQWAMAGHAMVDAYYENVAKLSRKERWTRYAVALTATNAAVVSAAAIIVTIP